MRLGRYSSAPRVFVTRARSSTASVSASPAAGSCVPAGKATTDRRGVGGARRGGPESALADRSGPVIAYVVRPLSDRLECVETRCQQWPRTVEDAWMKC